MYLLGAGLALVALALAFTDWALSLQAGVTEANCKRIRAGMTVAEVEAILGPPSSNNPPFDEVVLGPEGRPGLAKPGRWRHFLWVGDAVWVSAAVNEAGIVLCSCS